MNPEHLDLCLLRMKVTNNMSDDKSPSKEEVLKFINDFREYGERFGTAELFLSGYCYWFAYILKGRFPNAEIVYDAIWNHFTVKINDSQYDITGDVSSIYDEEPWIKFNDTLQKQRIVDCCINKTQ